MYVWQTHIEVYIDMYIYTYVCVCVCVKIKYQDIKPVYSWILLLRQK